MYSATSDHDQPDAGLYPTEMPFPLPPVLVRIDERDPTRLRDGRPVYVANLRWLANPRERLAPADISAKAASINAQWRVTRPGFTDHFALGPPFLPYIAGTRPRDRVQPKGAPSIAALLGDTVAKDQAAIFVYPVDLASPGVVTASVDAQPFDHGYAPAPPATVIRGPGDKAYLVVTIVQGAVEPAIALTDDLIGGGDQIVTEEVAVAMLAQFRAMYPDGAVNTIPRHRAPNSTDRTDALPALLARAGSGRGFADAIRKAVSRGPTLQPVHTQGYKGVKLVAGAAAVAAVSYFGATTLPVMYQEGRIPFLSKPPPPAPAYIPPAPAAAFAMPMPSAWIAACFDAMDDLYRAVPGYSHGQASCAAHLPPAPGVPRANIPGNGPVPAAAALASPPPPYGLASIAYTQLPGAKAGQVRDINATFMPASAGPADRAAGQPAIRIAEPPNMESFSAYRAMMPPAGKSPVFRGVHPLSHADELRRYLLDQRRIGCLNIEVKSPVDTQTVLLSSPGGPPYAVAPVSRLPITITTAMSPPNFTAFLDSLPGVVLLSVSRSFEDSATLATGGPDKSRMGASQAADKPAPGAGEPGGEAAKSERTRLHRPDLIVCDHPNYASLANWTLEATAYVLQ